MFAYAQKTVGFEILNRLLHGSLLTFQNIEDGSAAEQIVVSCHIIRKTVREVFYP